MPRGLVRIQQTGNFHFLTFSCYRRLPYLKSPAAMNLFEASLEEMRRRYNFLIAGYVVMPEHVHLLISEPRRGQVAHSFIPDVHLRPLGCAPHRVLCDERAVWG